MSTTPDRELDGLLRAARAGDQAAERQIVELLYRDLRVIAAQRLRRERPGHTWQPTALVHEALMRLRDDGTLRDAPDRAFLLRAASRAMRLLLVDHHRRRTARKRGGDRRRHPFDMALDHLEAGGEIRLVELRDAIDRLAVIDERAAMVVDLRFFMGMSPAEAAEELGVSLSSVERDWKFARGWLRDRLRPEDLP